MGKHARSIPLLRLFPPLKPTVLPATAFLLLEAAATGRPRGRGFSALVPVRRAVCCFCAIDGSG